MPFYYYHYTLMDDGTHEYLVFDRRLGDEEFGRTPNAWAAEKMIAALNAAEPVPAPKSRGIFD